MSTPPTYFISGHLDLTKNEFTQHYIPQLQNAILTNSSFIVGDARGADSLAQQYLLDNLNDTTKVIVYHMFEKPRNNVGNFATKGGFKSDETRDAQMTNDSDKDILWTRPVEEQIKKLGNRYNPQYISGTTKNMLRREKLEMIQPT